MEHNADKTGEIPADEIEVSPFSALDVEVLGPVVVIQLSRIYDAMMALLGTANPGLAASLAALHESGQFISAPPAFSEVTDE